MQLPTVPVATPWWQDAESVVSAVRNAHGIDVTILRILDTEQEHPHGGAVTYLAEGVAPVGAKHWHGTLETHSLRMPYAEPGGPDADLRWALSVLQSLNLSTTDAAHQVRTWNLSSIWKIPTTGPAGDQTVWLKVVPPFFAHEGPLIAALDQWRVPRLLGHDSGRLLLAEIPGHDLHDVDNADLPGMIELLVEMQVYWQSRIDELLALGLPDWREHRLTSLIEDVFARTQWQLDAQDRKSLEKFLTLIPHQFAQLANCGIDNSLVHGDFHTGNLRKHNGAFTLLDWGDAGVGHPMLDQPAFTDSIPNGAGSAVIAHWRRLWLHRRPGADVEQARILIGPIAAARQATVYQSFLDNIEPNEHRYHAADPVIWLRRTAELFRASE